MLVEIIRPRVDLSVIITIPLVLDQGWLMVRSLVRFFQCFSTTISEIVSPVPNRQFSLCQCIDAGLSSGSVVDSGDHGKISCPIFFLQCSTTKTLEIVAPFSN